MPFCYTGVFSCWREGAGSNCQGLLGSSVFKTASVAVHRIALPRVLRAR
jgi:hypothetical protein